MVKLIDLISKEMSPWIVSLLILHWVCNWIWPDMDRLQVAKFWKLGPHRSNSGQTDPVEVLIEHYPEASAKVDGSSVTVSIQKI